MEKAIDRDGGSMAQNPVSLCNCCYCGLRGAQCLEERPVLGLELCRTVMRNEHRLQDQTIVRRVLVPVVAIDGYVGSDELERRASDLGRNEAIH